MTTSSLAIEPLGVSHQDPQLRINRWQNQIRDRAWFNKNLHLALVLNLAHAIVQTPEKELVWVEDIKFSYPTYYEAVKDHLEKAPNREVIFRKEKKLQKEANAKKALEE